MARETHNRKELDPEELRKLAARIAEQIVSGSAPELPLGELLAAVRKCPEGHLCCFNAYFCAQDIFVCQKNFRCTNWFGGGLQAAWP